MHRLVAFAFFFVCGGLGAVACSSGASDAYNGKRKETSELPNTMTAAPEQSARAAEVSGDADVVALARLGEARATRPEVKAIATDIRRSEEQSASSTTATAPAALQAQSGAAFDAAWLAAMQQALRGDGATVSAARQQQLTRLVALTAAAPAQQPAETTSGSAETRSTTTTPATTTP